MKKTVCYVVMLSLLALIVHAGEVRTWTSSGGQHKIEAEFISVSEDGKIVVLRKTINVPFDQLSKEDQVYIARQKDANKRKEPEPKAVIAKQILQQPDAPEKIQMRKKIDAVNRQNDGTVQVELSEEEREGVVQYLLLAEKALKKKYDAIGISFLLRELKSKKSIGRTSSADIARKAGLVFPKPVKIDAYIACWAAYDSEPLTPSRDYGEYKRTLAIIMSLLPECNRLSGNAHAEKEKTRLENKRLEAEKDNLFSK